MSKYGKCDLCDDYDALDLHIVIRLSGAKQHWLCDLCAADTLADMLAALPADNVIAGDYTASQLAKAVTTGLKHRKAGLG